MINAVVALLSVVMFMQPGPTAPPKFSAKLLPAHESISPGGETELLVEITVDKPWHIYHPIILDTGLATNVQFTAPAGFEIGELRFPSPDLGETAEMEYLEHTGTVRAVAAARAPADATPGQTATVSAKITGLACIEMCLPVEASASLELPITAKPGAPANVDVFKKARDELAKPLGEAPYIKGSELSVSKEKLGIGESAELIATIRVEKGHHVQDRHPGVEDLIASRLFIENIDGIEFVEEEKQIWPKAHVRDVEYIGKVREQSGEFKIRVPFKIVDEKFASGPVYVRVLFRYQCCTDAGQCYPPEMAEGFARFAVDRKRVVSAAPAVQHPGGDENGGSTAASAADAATGDAAQAPPTQTGERRSLLWLFFAAFVGGVILNIMPCVLPVISLKIFSFVNQAGEDPKRIFRLGLVYGAGILASFLGIAVAMVSAGYAWGGLMQSSGFMIALAAGVFAFALSLLGVFEITLPGSTMNAASSAASREGFGGAFLNGVMTTALATPCTAPLLGPAIGLLTQYPPIIMGAGIMTVGAGLAAPYVLLTAFPGWLRFLPKPGPWMVTFKQIVGFVLLGVVVWLFSILYELADRADLLGALVLLCAVGMACWLLGRLGLNASMRKSALTWMAAIALFFGGWFGGSAIFSRSWQKIPWQEWAPGHAQELARDGFTVYVDYTATWCLTCQTNKRLVLETDAIRGEFDRLNVVPIKADFTNYDEKMQEELNDHGRNGVPLNLVFPAGKPTEAIALPEVLTPSIVLEALEKAGPSDRTPDLVVDPH